jgi:hypothetical protein
VRQIKTSLLYAICVHWFRSIPLLDDPWVILTRRDSELAAAEVPTFDLL